MTELTGAHPSEGSNFPSDEGGNTRIKKRGVLEDSSSAGSDTATDFDDVIRRKLSLGSIVMGSFFYYIVGIIFIAFYAPAFIFKFWWAIPIPFAAILVYYGIVFVRGSLRESLPTTRAAAFMFLVLPSLLVALGGVILLSHTSNQVIALRGGFLIVVCFLPALMWYLFISTRKASLLNEFLTNLKHLGLLDSAN